VLTTPQPITLTARPERTIDYRLTPLRERSLVDWTRPYAASGSAPFYWWLTRTGARLVEGTSPASGKSTPNPVFLRHTAAIPASTSPSSTPARSADRPRLRAMLARVAEDGDVDAVVVHKVNRLARNIEDHIAILALLRRRGVALVSMTENLDETASGRLVEGIHALMAEFYSANLAAEVRKGMGQKAKLGGYPHKAPIGYLNVREPIGGR